METQQLYVNAIRCLAIDMIEEAHSGHPGLPLGAAPLAYVLWMKHLKHNPGRPGWFDRDRFILSAGHGSAMLYSLLYLTGYELTLQELKNFRRWQSLTPGHPERGVTPGVEVTTGPLGQGFANGVGLAIAEAYLAARFNRPGHNIIDHFTYTIASDGDFMEGVSSEAASLAGHLRLGKLICLYDANRVSLSGSTGLHFTEDIPRRFEACGWQVMEVNDGNDLKAIDGALVAARKESARPSLIMVRTEIGFGSPRQGSFKSHGEPLGAENVKMTKRSLVWPEEPAFSVPAEALEHFRGSLLKGKMAEEEWEKKFAAYGKEFPTLAADLNRLRNGELPGGWENLIPSFPADSKGIATRVASGLVMNSIAHIIPELIGGAADMNPSTHTELKGLGNFESPGVNPPDTQGAAAGVWDFSGRNIHFGVREHAMGAILNGMAAHVGIIPFGGTFLMFSDYMRAPLRLAALSGLHVVYLFTHDSIGLGQDGPTHQPVEQLPGLRSIPGMTVIRPCDANETAEAWKVALLSKGKPVSLVLSRQGVPTLDRKKYSSAGGLARGAYILADADGEPELILVASGSEVHLIVEARERLEKKGIRARAVSMPSWDLFERQPREYREEVLPANVRKRLSVEAASSQGWHKYIGSEGAVIAVEGFGHSAPGEELMERHGFSVDNVVRTALELLETSKTK